MHNDNLFKGFEVELFTGSHNKHVGVSDEIEKTFLNFVKEPDNRNVEYITPPEKDYKVNYKNLLEPRQNLLSSFFLNLGGLTKFLVHFKVLTETTVIRGWGRDILHRNLSNLLGQVE